jgi:hypothetical protein
LAQIWPKISAEFRRKIAIDLTRTSLAGRRRGRQSRRPASRCCAVALGQASEFARVGPRKLLYTKKFFYRGISPKF